MRMRPIVLVLSVLSLSPRAAPQPPAADEERDRAIVERILAQLEKDPRRGAALDRAYGHHAERGALDELVRPYRRRTEKDPKDGTAWMILGLVEAQRGRDAAAAEAFRHAEKHLPDSALAPYYLGQSLVLVGQPEAAAEAFERAIARRPLRQDLLDVYQALGRLHQRAQRTEEALKVWARMEEAFADNPRQRERVQEQIATALAEEGQYRQALARFDALTAGTRDTGRRARYRLEAAELKVRLGQAPQALAALEELLGGLDADSWLAKEVRRKIEEVFLRNDDLAGLAKYYEGWVAKNPEDIDAVARLARALSLQGRTAEARAALEKAVKLAPSRKDLRLALVEHLVQESNVPGALAQYEALDRSDRDNPDTLREWGRLILKDASRPEAERQKAAKAVWERLLRARPKDPVAAAQVADLLRQAGMTDDAVALYRRAVELAPGQPQYREYLGEYYHSLKRANDARATWRQIAAGENRNARNLTRLAEVLASFGYYREAVAAVAEAGSLDRDDFALQLKHAELLQQAERLDDALKQLETAGKLADNDEEAEAVLEQEIKCRQALGTLATRADALQKELSASKGPGAKGWYRLARYREAARQVPETEAALRKALELDDRSVPAWVAAARAHEAAGNQAAAAGAYRKLAALDRRLRGEHLNNVARLEARLGRRREALEAGREVLDASPNNPDAYRAFAELCFQLGEADEGLAALRRAVRVSPGEAQPLLALARALADRFRTGEAIELYSKAFERSASLDDRLAVVPPLAELYLQSNQLDRLLERLGRERREEGRRRDLTLCLALAHQAAGDTRTARQELDGLLADSPRDTQLLQQLVQFAESEADTAAAVKYQRQLNQAAPSKEGEGRLARLLVRAGEVEEAGAIWARLAAGEQDVGGALKLLDRLAEFPAGRPGQATAPLALVASSVTGLMKARMNAGAAEDVLRALDGYLDGARRQKERAPAAGRGGAAAPPPANPFARSAQPDYPPPNDHYDAAALQVLHGAFELYRRKDLLSDLTGHFRTRLARAGPPVRGGAERTQLRLGLAYLQWWADDKDEALEELTRATEDAPADAELRLEVAQLRERRGELDEALALADSVTPLDHATTQRRETLALRVAARVGKAGRARQAAERLFGLRLDAQAQVQLAGQLHQLGMHAEAEAVLERARNQAGSRTPALAGLMQQYQAQNNPDAAAQIAYQILRRVPPSPPQGPSPSLAGLAGGGAPSEEVYREQALQVLARSGRLRELIDRTESQLKSAPHSLQLYQALANYYQAAGQRDKMGPLYERMARLRPDDARLRAQAARHLAEAGQPAAAAGHYLAAFKKEPSLLADQWHQVRLVFQQANKFDELVRLLEETDLRSSLRYYFLVSDVLDTLLRDAKTRAQGLRLFRKAWQEFPGEREQLLGSLRSEELWRAPEIYDYVRQAVIPEDGKPAEPWAGFVSSEFMSFFTDESDGRSLVGRLLDLAERQKQLGALAGELERALGKHPGWKGGRALLALVQLRQGTADEARRALRELAEDAKGPIPLRARGVVGREVEKHPPLLDLAVKIYEGGAEQALGSPEEGFRTTPVRRLIALHQKAGRREEARALILQFARPPGEAGGEDGPQLMPPGFAEYQRARDLSAMGEQLLQLGYPLDAVRLYRDVLADGARLQAAMNWGDSSMKQQAEQGLGRCLQALKPEALPQVLRGLTRPEKDAKAAGPSLDLVLLVRPRDDLLKAQLVSMPAEALRLARARPELLAEVRVGLGKLRAQHPRDLSVHLAAALAALAEDGPGAGDAVRRLTRLVEQAPLEELPDGGRANARQRAAAEGQVSLWLAARECLRRPALREAGDALAARAVEAARRQSDPAYALAMLREWGRIELERGDRKAAERHWARMLELVLASPARRKPAPKAGGRGDKGIAPAAPPPPTPPARPAAPAATLGQFEQAMQIARLAAENRMHALSLRAVRDSLRGGPPALPVPAERPAFVPRPVREPSVPEQVEARLRALDALWRRHGAPAADVYDALAGVVLPEGRAGEVVLYAAPLAAANAHEPRSVGRLLARWAAQAGRADELRRRVAERLDRPTAELPARVLLAQLGLAARDARLARESLDWLGKRLQKDSLQNTAELACHAALPALRGADTAAAALAVAGRAADNLSRQPRDVLAPGLHLLLARTLFEGGKVSEGRQSVQDYLKASERADAPVGPDRGKERYRRAAAAFLRARQTADALEMLGRYADAPAAGAAGPAAGPTLAALARQLAARPPRERYELLRDWALPAPGRLSVRGLSAHVPAGAPPEAFGKLPAVPGGVVGLVPLLVDAAKESGRLDELAALARKAEAGGAAGSGDLTLLVRLARGEGEAAGTAIRKRLADHAGSGPGPATPAAPLSPTDLVVARSAMADPSLRGPGEELARHLLERAKRSQDHLAIAWLRRELGASAAAREGAPHLAAEGGPGLALWHAASHLSTVTHAAGPVPTWWVASEGLIAHVAGAELDYLYFAYPLAGTFDFSVDAYDGAWAEGHVSYGGQLLIHGGPGSFHGVLPVGWHESRALPARFTYNRREAFNRLTVQVRPGKVRFLVNGHPVYEDADPSPASPWLALYSAREKQTAFRNPTLVGSPEVPREVRLVHGDRLDGWVTGFYGETQPPRLSVAAPGPDEQPVVGDPDPDAYDWAARDGVIRGRAVPQAAAPAVQSRLYYHRPLRDAEEVRYEFYYQPGADEVHPALGRLALLLEPGGVRLHWMTAGAEDGTGLGPDNVADEPANRRGPKRLPLKPGEWNAVRLALKGDTAVLELNGEKVYERELERTNDRLFGFFHYKDRTAVRARNVVLKGDWPEALTAAQLANLTARVGAKPSVADRRGRAAVIGESFHALNADDVLRRARALKAGERYALLLDWVVPGESHSGFRLYGHFAPAAAPPVGKSPARRAQPGGALEAPARELVAAAGELGRLDELAGRVEKAAADSDQDRRGRLALLALVRSAQGRDEEAADALKQLLPLSQKLADGAPDWARWPELVAASSALRRSKTRAPALALLDQLVEKVKPGGFASDWAKHAQHARAVGQLLALPEARRGAAGTDPGLARWAPVTHATAATRGAALPPALWSASGGELMHHPGHGEDWAYFAVPLRGNFEVRCELTGGEGREAELCYGGLRVGVRPDGKGYELAHLTRPLRTGAIDPPLKLGDWYAFRLVVKDGTCSAHVNGRKVHEERLPPGPDPWLAVRAPGRSAGGVRKLAIVGGFTVPEGLDLSAHADLSGWLADYYAESTAGDDLAWAKRGGEIVGRALPQAPGCKQESLLQYHRPLLEDGEVEYEFYCEPGKALVHPALDRLAFLLAPDGVKVHRLTNDKFDRTGLAPDNATAEPAHRRGPERVPLKARDWNRVKLAVAGDKVSLRLNDVEVYERPLEPTNQRAFGLFHFADETEVRVRGVRYQGRWPRALPPEVRSQGSGVRSQPMSPDP